MRKADIKVLRLALRIAIDSEVALVDACQTEIIGFEKGNAIRQVPVGLKGMANRSKRNINTFRSLLKKLTQKGNGESE